MDKSVILIIESTPEWVVSWRHILESIGHTCIFTPSSKDCAELIENPSRNIHIIVFGDIPFENSVTKNDLDLLEQIKSTRPNTPIISSSFSERVDKWRVTHGCRVAVEKQALAHFVAGYLFAWNFLTKDRNQ